jgi:hypothetical protein
MKSIFAAGITAMALGFAATAAADDHGAPFYIHLEKAGLELIEYSGGGSLPVRNVVDADAWQGRFGYQMNENFAIEAGYSQSEENVAGETQSFGVVLIRSGAPAATTIPFSKIPVNIYAMIGKSFGEVNLSNGSSEDIAGFAAGVGIGFQFTETFEVAVDWLTYGEDDNLGGTIDGFRLAGFSLGLRLALGGGDD